MVIPYNGMAAGEIEVGLSVTALPDEIERVAASLSYCRSEPQHCAMVQYGGGFAVLLGLDHPTMVLEVSERGRQALTLERVKYGKVQHESQLAPASGDTKSRRG
jgi:hypothetical protein